MNKVYLVIGIFLLSIACNSPVAKKKEKADLGKLISFMEGSFSSEEQAQADTNYLHITLDMQQIWKDNTEGAWLYVEQTAAWTPGKPYRQRIYHLEQLSDSTFSSSIYKMPRQEIFVGGYLNPEVFVALSPDSLTILEGCALLLTYKNGVFAGRTVEDACKNAWGEANYATSEVNISRDTLNSWDRGWNDKKEQVWGAEKGGYKFVRVETIK